MAIHDICGKRDEPLPIEFRIDTLPDKLRTQILYIWEDTILRFNEEYEDCPPTNDVVAEIRGIVLRELGAHHLFHSTHGPLDDTLNCISLSMDVDVILAVVEVSIRKMFTVFAAHRMRMTPEEAVHEFNHRFRENGVGVEFDLKTRSLLPFSNLLLHNETIHPALTLLSAPEFAGANVEFQNALDHFKKGEWGDCLSEACKSLESVLKVVLAQNGWAYDATAPANKLLKTYMDNIGDDKLPGYFESPLILIATLRNKLDAHGAGSTPHAPPPHLAKYSLYATASAIVLLVDAGA